MMFEPWNNPREVCVFETPKSGTSSVSCIFSRVQTQGGFLLKFYVFECIIPDFDLKFYVSEDSNPGFWESEHPESEILPEILCLQTSQSRISSWNSMFKPYKPGFLPEILGFRSHQTRDSAWYVSETKNRDFDLKFFAFETTNPDFNLKFTVPIPSARFRAFFRWTV